MTLAKFKVSGGKIVEGVAECSVDGTALTMCFLLESLVGWFGDSARTRVEKSMMVALKHDGKRDAIALHHRAKYAVFDFCPFCGQSLRTSFGASPAAAPAAKGDG